MTIRMIGWHPLGTLPPRSSIHVSVDRSPIRQRGETNCSKSANRGLSAYRQSARTHRSVTMISSQQRVQLCSAQEN